MGHRIKWPNEKHKNASIAHVSLILFGAHGSSLSWVRLSDFFDQTQKLRLVGVDLKMFTYQSLFSSWVVGKLNFFFLKKKNIYIFYPPFLIIQ